MYVKVNEERGSSRICLVKENFVSTNHTTREEPHPMINSPNYQKIKEDIPGRVGGGLAVLLGRTVYFGSDRSTHVHSTAARTRPKRCRLILSMPEVCVWPEQESMRSQKKR